MTASADTNRDLPRDEQQILVRNLKATNPSSLPVRLASEKTIRRAKSLSFSRKRMSQEQRRKVAEMRRSGACVLPPEGKSCWLLPVIDSVSILRYVFQGFLRRLLNGEHFVIATLNLRP